MMPRFLVVVFFAGLMTLQAATTERGGSETRGAACEDALTVQGEAIYTSEYKRTKSTAAPLAQLLSIEPKTMPALDVDGLVSVLKAAPLNAVILVVTHSDRLPILAGRSGANTSSITLRFGEILE